MKQGKRHNLTLPWHGESGQCLRFRQRLYALKPNLVSSECGLSSGVTGEYTVKAIKRFAGSHLVGSSFQCHSYLDPKARNELEILDLRFDETSQPFTFNKPYRLVPVHNLEGSEPLSRFSISVSRSIFALIDIRTLPKYEFDSRPNPLFFREVSMSRPNRSLVCASAAFDRSELQAR
jgi:hypothetical protein